MSDANDHKTYRTGLAITAVVISVLALSLGDAIIKAAGYSLPLWQMYILRSGLALPVLMGIYLLRDKKPRLSILWISLRSALLVLMWLCYYSALPAMPLSLAAAAYYTAPIFIIILSAIIYKKRPSIGASTSIILGFGGVMLILRPDATEFPIVTLLPVLAAILYAMAMMLTSVKCRHEDPITLVIALNIAFIICGSALGIGSGAPDSFLFGSWVPLDWKLIGILAVLSCAIVVGGVGAAVAYQHGPPTTAAAFDYSYLVFSLIWGVVFFSESPSWISLIGIGLIFIAGLLALYSSSKSTS